MKKLHVKWDDYLVSLDPEFEYTMKSDSKGFKLDKKIGGQKSFVNQIESLPDFNQNTPPSCDYFYHMCSKKIFGCLEFSDLKREFKAYPKSYTREEKIEKIFEGIYKKINSTKKILKVLYNSPRIELENFPPTELQKHFFIIWKKSEDNSGDTRYFDDIQDQIRIECSDRTYKDFWVMDIEIFEKKYLQNNSDDLRN